jgi:hypothetical protein
MYLESLTEYMTHGCHSPVLSPFMTETLKLLFLSSFFPPPVRFMVDLEQNFSLYLQILTQIQITRFHFFNLDPVNG